MVDGLSLDESGHVVAILDDVGSRYPLDWFGRSRSEVVEELVHGA